MLRQRLTVQFIVMILDKTGNIIPLEVGCRFEFIPAYSRLDLLAGLPELSLSPNETTGKT